MALAATPAAYGEENTPDLVVGGLAPVSGLRPGDGFDVAAAVANKGTVTAEKVWVAYSVTRGLDFAEVPSNCQVQHVRPYDEMPERWTAVCAFDQAVKAGAVYTTDRPLRVTALGRALNDEVRLRVESNDPGADDNGSDPVPGTAPPVRLVETEARGERSARIVDVPVTTVNTADYQVTGAALAGSVGDTVRMKVKFTNAGPAWVWPREGDKAVHVVITPPTGTSVVKRGTFCRAEDGAYVCGMRSLYEGSGETYTFDLRIDKRVPGAKGSIALSTEARPFDPDKADDRADITLDVTGGGSSGSAGGSVGSGGSDGTVGGSTSGTGGSTAGSDGSTGTSTNGSTGTSTSGSGGGSSSTVTGGTTSGGTTSGGTTSGGNLAETGSSTLPVAGVAAGAVVVGSGVLLVQRRRQVRRPD
ncbi:hypothetical protein GCM10018980_18090 [Streptomyces capoamus]|uniref:DUF11 domain-containing protein n=1 Tax=Streptomyces capoamus TaxID=68183 RepID=A0A919C267_9ACTN|nr:hypothetical protein GCM10010501_31710 [Streptomyces libani subsp. rufus]GHG42386.1 hypothetical protein GCM10018980_18090 [Streptomyces capoamus]